MKNLNSLPIGVFDSGIGGLTVLDKLIEFFPNEDFYYIGDTLNLPYGTKTNKEVSYLVSEVSNYLVNLPVKAIVIACNTATTNAHHLDLKIPVIGVINPTALYTLKISPNILVLATNVTILNGEYQKIISSQSNSSNQFYLPASEFVDAIEDNQINNEYSFKLVENKLSPYKEKVVDAIILGCTHFGLYEKEIKNVFPKATLVECATPTALALKEALEKNNLLNPKQQKGIVTVNVTKAQENFYSKTKWFKKVYKGCFEINIKDGNL